MKTGKLSESILKRSVLKEIKTKRSEIIKGAAVGNDCALFALSKDCVCATATQEGQIILEGAAAIVQRCLNNLAIQGAQPVAVSTTLLLPENTEESFIKETFRAMETVLAPLSVQILGGQTSVSKAVLSPWLIVTGYGTIPRQDEAVPKPCGGMDVVVTKWIGLEGTAILADAFAEKILDRYPAFLWEEAKGFGKYLSILPEAATAVKSGVCAMHDASKGGIFAALWELAQVAGVGLTIDLKKIPLRQETVEICELLEVNPYKLLAGGALVMISPQGETLVEALQQQGIAACVIGTTTDTNDKVLMNEEEVRFLEKPDQDEIYRTFSY